MPANASLKDRNRCLARVRELAPGHDRTAEALFRDLHTFAANHDAIDATVASSRPGSRGEGGGALLFGKPGTGKTKLAKAVVESSGFPYEMVNGPDIFRTDSGASEAALTTAFSIATRKARAADPPTIAVLLIDEVDVIAGKNTKSDHREGVESRLLAHFLALIDGIGGDVFVIGASNRPHAIHPSVTRSGRLDRHYELAVTSSRQRVEMLDILTKKLPFDDETERRVILNEVGKAAHGFVPSDLQNLCTAVALTLVRRAAAGGTEDEITAAAGNDRGGVLTLRSFQDELKNIQPSDLGEFQTKRPTNTFAKLYGLEGPINQLSASIIHPFRHPEDFLRLGIDPPRGVMVHGPPGVGKTALCLALANETGVNFIYAEASQLRSKVVGESEQKIAKIFRQARANAPCILFLDQLDVLAPSRGSASSAEGTSDRIITSLLTEMDGFFSSSSKRNVDDANDAAASVQVDLLVVAATNRPEVVDAALLRPGRLDQHVHIPPPNAEDRRKILTGVLSTMPSSLSADDIATVAETTSGFSGADLENLCREAALICLRENICAEAIHDRHFDAARLLVRASLIDYDVAA